METNNQIKEINGIKPIETKKRKRIPIIKAPNTTPAIHDGVIYEKNRCVDRAAFLHNVARGYDVDIWFAEHYHDRHLNGDENGKRDGIEPKLVQALVERSLKHIFHYSCMYSTFKLINFTGQSEPRTAAIVLQETQSNGQLLNVVVEVHLIDICKYEITVKTAMCDDHFKLWAGQYVIEIEEDMSILKRYVNNNLVIV